MKVRDRSEADKAALPEPSVTHQMRQARLEHLEDGGTMDMVVELNEAEIMALAVELRGDRNMCNMFRANHSSIGESSIEFIERMLKAGGMRYLGMEIVYVKDDAG